MPSFRLTHPKPLESEIQSGIFDYLRRVEMREGGRVLGFVRLNSGGIRTRDGGWGGFAYRAWLRGELAERSSGLPDLLLIFRDGTLGWVEVKRHGEPLTVPQGTFRDWCIAYHVRHVIVHSHEELKNWIESLKIC
jgi:hypothetical protein